MALIDSAREVLADFAWQVGVVETSKQLLERSSFQDVFNNRLFELTDALRHVSTLGDAELSMQMERVCITFEMYSLHVPEVLCVCKGSQAP